MPWTVDDVEKHKKGLTEAEKKQWVEVANSVRAKCLEDGDEEAECDAAAIRQANGVVGNQEMNVDKLTCHNFQTYNYDLHTIMYEGRQHLIVPVIMFVEGVHHGSAGPILYTAEELSKFPAAWNGRPVPVFHPQAEDGTPISCNDPKILETSTVGKVFDVHFEDGKLRGDIWIDETKIKKISPTALSYIRTGKKMEVSTGLFSDEEPVSGEWNGEQYVCIARNLRPDHLALLPGEN